jgi:hypothetical protein
MMHSNEVFTKQVVCLDPFRVSGMVRGSVGFLVKIWKVWMFGGLGLLTEGIPVA